MPTSDLLNILQWWIIIFLIGFTFLPLSALIFNNFIDKGYILAKILGLLIISFIVWLLANLHILPFTSLTIYLTVGLALAANIFISRKFSLTSVILSKTKTFLLEELLFLIGLIFWAFVRAHEPSIHGLEKFMDFGFINSILRADYFPPKDIWLTPFSINYYYFGHYLTAFLTKLSGIDSIITYNLMLATLFGLTLAASFSVGFNLYYLFSKSSSVSSNLSKRYTLYAIISGLLSSFLVTLGGNLHTIYIFFQTYTPADNPVPFWTLPLQWNIVEYWYPNATRFIPFTIHEFPLYSFVVADLHGHVFDIPFVILAIALMVKYYFQDKTAWWQYFIFGLLVGVFLMTNVLDGPIYLILVFLAIFIKQLRNINFSSSLKAAFKYTAIVGLGAIIFSLPFWISFSPFSSGIGVLCAPSFLTKIGKIGPLLFEANHCARSPIWMLTILWGFFYFVWIGFLILVVKKQLKDFRSLNRVDLTVILLGIFATILILIPEFFYAKDIYPAHYRANTVFKFGYQAFIVLGLISGYAITRFLTAFRKTILYTLYAIFLILTFSLVAIYPYFAIKSYYNVLEQPAKELNGLAYLSDLYPDDYQAILWLRENIKDQPVILEAQGDSYTDYARVSSNTGLPTVIGWPVHEWLWRGSYNEAGQRSSEVTQIYESTDLNYTKAEFTKYHVQYVFIGDLERQKYLNLNEEQFSQLGKVVFQSGEARVYRLK